MLNLQYDFDWIDFYRKSLARTSDLTACVLNKGEAVSAIYVRSNDFTRSREDENKNSINKIYARLAVVARVDLRDASYSARSGACA